MSSGGELKRPYIVYCEHIVYTASFIVNMMRELMKENTFVFSVVYTF